MFAATLPSLLLISATPGSAGSVRQVIVAGNQVTVALDGQVGKIASLTLSNPQRIVLDINAAESGPVSQLGEGVVSRVRIGQYAAHTTRVVFELSEPAKMTNTALSPDNQQLTFTLSAIDRPQFAAANGARAAISTPTQTSLDFFPPARSRHSVTMPLEPAGAPLPRPHIMGPAGRPLVVIDPGHGGQDPGAVNLLTGEREKDITLATAKRIRTALLATGRVRVALTRDDDHFIILRERSAIAHNLGADLFISIHADSEPGNDAHGATVYTLSEGSSDREAQALAARENKADLIHGVNLSGENADVASILLDLAQRETMNQSSAFASLLKREGSSIPFRNDYHRTAGFAVLKQPDMPSILLEIGYISNPFDVTRITSVQGEDDLAQGIRKAVTIHFAKRLASN